MTRTFLLLGSGEFEPWTTDVERRVLAGATGNGSVASRPLVTMRVPAAAWFVGIDERTAIFGDGTAWEVAGLATVTVRHEHGSSTYRSGDRFATAASVSDTPDPG